MESASQAQFVVTSKGGLKLHYEGFVYRIREVRKSGTVSWKCDRACKEFKCPGNATTDGKGEGATVLSTTQHSHMPDPSRASAEKIKDYVRANSLLQPTATPTELLAAATQGVPESQLSALPPKKTLKETAHRARRLSRKRELDAEDGVAPNADTLASLAIPQSVQLYSGSQFLLWDSGVDLRGNRTLCFGTMEGVAFLAGCRTWAADGTFKIAPAIFAQCYTVHGHKNGFVLPCLYFLFPDKARATYLAAWGKTRELVFAAYPGAPPPDHLITDFEVAAYGAMQEVYPGAQAHLCYFHLGQSVDRKVVQCGLRDRYADDEGFRLRTKMLSASAFLPVDQVGQGFEMLEEEFSGEEAEIPEYFESNYVGRVRPGGGRRVARFPLEAWNIYSRRGQGVKRTNNDVEGFHNAMSSGLVRAAHPCFWKFVESIKAQQSIANVDMAAVNRGDEKIPPRKQQARDARLETLARGYEGDGDVKKLLRGVAYNYF